MPAFEQMHGHENINQVVCTGQASKSNFLHEKRMRHDFGDVRNYFR